MAWSLGSTLYSIIGAYIKNGNVILCLAPSANVSCIKNSVLVEFNDETKSSMTKLLLEESPGIIRLKIPNHFEIKKIRLFAIVGDRTVSRTFFF
jgi:hypothetical protein